MKRFLDASVLVRHITGTPEHQAQAATALMKSGQSLHVSAISLMETGFVLEKVVGQSRQDVADALLSLVREPHVRLNDLDYHQTLQALLHFRHRPGVSLGDALLWAIASDDRAEIYTFDIGFLSEGLTIRQP